jgi:signal transduction histidine kinase
MSNQPNRLPFTAIAVGVIMLVGALTGTSLYLLSQLRSEATHIEATRSILDKGRLITAHLAAQPIIAADEEHQLDWQGFAELIGGLHTLEEGLEYVKVTREDVVLFQQQIRSLESDGASPPLLPTPPTDDVAMARRLLLVGDRQIPVILFSMSVTGSDGSRRQVEVAVQREAVTRAEGNAIRAARSMFKLSLISVLVAFAACTLLMFYIGRREVRREQLRREEEHLAFSGVLANGIVHDFRNPMSSMRLDIQMLQRESAKGEAARSTRVAELATRVCTTMDRLDKVFQEFLFFSKPASNARADIELVACIRECVDMLRGRLEQGELTVAIAAEPEPLHVAVFEASLRRALVNILTNAEQFSPPGGTIRIDISAQDDFARIDVVDEGPGMSKDARRRAFEMFTTTRPEGTGLGLFLSKAAVERSGGRIEIPERATGTCIRMHVPLAAQPADDKLIGA